MPPTPEGNRELLRDLLRRVSRSFYLTLRVLPGGVRDPIGLAYLLARATDTIADTGVVPVPRRLEMLELLRDRVMGSSTARLPLQEFRPQHASGAEWTLLERIEDALDLLAQAEHGDRERIREVLKTILSGQALDLRRFGAAGPGAIIALATDAELDDYTYRVAGCVGEFWTQMCRAQLFPEASLDEGALLSDAVRFGKGLQLVNILRDLPADLRAGRCYLPQESLRGAGLEPPDLLNPGNEARLRPLYDGLLDRAEAHLAAGWRYTNALPGNQRRVRLACAWPVLIGVRTLALLRCSAVLDPSHRVKVGRAEVRGIVWRSLMRLPRAGAWRRQFAEAGGREALDRA